MKKNGKQLEKTIRLIQETYKDSPNTEIFSNHKIENESGRKREFDIVIVSKLNDFEIKIVIECKDYSKKVAVKEIEAFNSKCERIRGINKKVFVSSMGYQADAVECANRFNIELLIASELSSKIIEQWFPVKQVKFNFTHNLEVRNMYLDCDDGDYLQKITSTFDKFVYVNDKKKHISTVIIEAAYNHKNIVLYTSLLVWLKLDESKKLDPFKVPFQIDFNDVTIRTFDNKIINVSSVDVNYVVQFTEEVANIKTARHLVDSIGDIKANAVTIKMEKGDVGDIVYGKNNKIDIFVTNDQGKTKKLDLLLTYDPKTDTFY